MIKSISFGISSVLFWGLSAVINPVLADPRIDIEYETQSFENKTISDGLIKVSVGYKPFNWEAENPEEYNLTYKIYYDQELKVDEKDATVNVGSVFLQDLDNNQTPEVIVSTFSGGAHCCQNFIIYAWENNQFSKTETGFLDGAGGRFEDLDQDGTFEFITYDNNFLYTFASYAGSFPPSQILRFQDGKFTDVTRQYPDFLRETANEMYKVILESKQNDQVEINGVLAGYVAQKALLGEFEEGWNFMLENYDHNSEWGLEIYENDQQVGQYPDFPTALKALLTKLGYI